MLSRVKYLVFGLFVVALLAFVAAMLPLNSIYNSDSSGVNGSSYFGGPLMLDQSELDVKKRLAEEGDGEAAYLVYQHYAFGMDDTSEAQPWLEKSVAADYPIAIQALANLEEISRERTD